MFQNRDLLIALRKTKDPIVPAVVLFDAGLQSRVSKCDNMRDICSQQLAKTLSKLILELSY
jgi:hypothetical protein